MTGIQLTGIWDERAGGRTILAGIDLAADPGESVALMGRNGAGKSTLLRHAAGLLEPSRGKVRAAGPIAYLSQTPGAYLPGDRLGDCLSDDLLRAADLTGLADRNPRDLSGGEAQRAALALATSSAAGDGAPAVVLLDEPTRGMDAGHRAALIGQLRLLAGAGAAVIVATHDPELAAAACERTVLMGEGVVLADSGTVEILTGGWYFTTETSRVLGGAGGALLPAEGAAMIRESARAAQTAGPR